MAPSVEPCALQVGHLAGHMACYPYDLDEATQRQLARGSLIREFMKQAPGQPYSVVQQVALIYTATRTSVLDGVNRIVGYSCCVPRVSTLPLLRRPCSSRGCVKGELSTGFVPSLGGAA